MKNKKINNNNNNKARNTKKRMKFYNTVFLYFAFFAISIFVIIFLMQIIFLKPMYKSSKEKQIKRVAEEIEEKSFKGNLSSKNEESFKNEIDKIAYNNQIQIYLYQKNDIYYISESSPGRIPQNINNEIKIILDYLKENNVKEYTKNVTLKKLNTNANIYVRSLISNQEKPFNNDFKIVIVSPLDQIDSTIEVLTLQNLYISIFAILIALLISIILSRKISSPIENITKEARLLEEGKYDLNIPETQYYETENLRNVLLKSSQKLKEKDAFQKNIIANVSHDLKTPLSIIKAYTEKIQDITGDDKIKREEDLKIISKETENLSLLISDILDLSKLDAGGYLLKVEKFNIIEVININLKRLEPIKDKKSIKIKVNIEKKQDKIIVSGDKLKISQVIYNLILNALKYSKPKSTVNVNITLIKNGVKIEIQDFGKGVSKKDLPNIFSQYYKSNDKSRKEDIASTGLGLSIVKSILEKHEFDYGVESEEDKGTKIWFIIDTIK